MRWKMSNILANRYRLINSIGKGGMAEVFLAIDEVLNREVAIKIMKGELSGDDNAVERFKREAMAVTKLVHPNIVEVYDVGEEENKNFIVMEYVRGLTLKKFIKKRHSIDTKEAIFLIRQLVSAIGKAHKAGIIHRDIKPQNIIIKDDGTLKILDFGIALAHDAMQITGTDAIIGSVHYLAPELSFGKQAGVCSDLYSIGVVLYELLSGEVPYKADNPIDIALSHVKKPFPRIRKINDSIPQSVENIITKCVAKNPKDRYQDIQELNIDLSVCLTKEHLHDKRLIIDNFNNKKINKKKNKNDVSTVFTVLFSILLSLFAVVVVVGFLYLNGFFGHKDVRVKMPNIVGMTVAEAQEVLRNKGLSVDIDKIKRTLNDKVEKGKIISFTPAKDTELKKGDTVIVTVSDGIYALMDDYVGKNIKYAKQEIHTKYRYVNIIEIASKNKGEAGLIEKQELLLPNQKFDPNIVLDIKLTYIPYLQIIMPDELTLRNMKINEAEKYFKDKGFKVELHKMSEEEISEYGELSNAETFNRYKNRAYDSKPKPGLYYTQEGDSVITIYYY